MKSVCERPNRFWVRGRINVSQTSGIRLLIHGEKPMSSINVLITFKHMHQIWIIYILRTPSVSYMEIRFETNKQKNVCVYTRARAYFFLSLSVSISHHLLIIRSYSKANKTIQMKLCLSIAMCCLIKKSVLYTCVMRSHRLLKFDALKAGRIWCCRIDLVSKKHFLWHSKCLARVNNISAKKQFIEAELIEISWKMKIIHSIDVIIRRSIEIQMRSRSS